jgi:hypothetical protein
MSLDSIVLQARLSERKATLQEAAKLCERTAKTYPNECFDFFSGAMECAKRLYELIMAEAEKEDQ